MRHLRPKKQPKPRLSETTDEPFQCPHTDCLGTRECWRKPGHCADCGRHPSYKPPKHPDGWQHMGR